MAENETATEELEETTETETAADAAEPTEQKSDVPAEVKRALQKANKEAETLRLRLKEFEDRDKTDAQKLQEERDSLLAERDSLRSETLRREVADAKGLTPAQARRLVGTTREELEADADDVLEVFPTKAAKPEFADLRQGHQMDGNPRIYRQSELNDHTFWKANKADILAAINEGRVKD